MGIAVAVVNKRVYRSNKNDGRKHANGIVESAVGALQSNSRSSSTTMFEWDHSNDEYHGLGHSNKDNKNNNDVTELPREPNPMNTIQRKANGQYRSFIENASELESQTDEPTFENVRDEQRLNPESPEGDFLESAASLTATRTQRR